VCREVDYRDVRKELANINWIFFGDDDGWMDSITLMLRALDNGMYMQLLLLRVTVICCCLTIVMVCMYVYVARVIVIGLLVYFVSCKCMSE